MKKFIILFFLIVLIVPVCLAKSYNKELFKAVEAGNHNAVLKLLKSGANPNILSLNGEFTPLLVAVDNNDVDTAQVLLDYGADPNFRAMNDMSPVMSVVIRNNPDDMKMLRLLLEYGADYTSPSEFQYSVNPVSLSMKLKNYNAFNMFNEYGKFGKCEIAFYKMQGQSVKNEEHWNAIKTWKSCNMMPLNDSLIGLSFDDIIKQFGKPVSSTHVGKNSFDISYVNLYSKYIDNPLRKKNWVVRPESSTNTKRRLVNRCKEYKAFSIDDGIVVDIKNSDYKGDNPIMYYLPKM